MWFKNIHVFQLLEPFSWRELELQEVLSKDKSRHCGQLEKSTYGWTAPLGAGAESLVHCVGPYMLIAARKEEKLLPSSVIQEEVQERIAQIEAEQGKKISSREKRSLREEITLQLLPKALAKSDVTYGYVDKERGWLMVDTASHTKAEEFIILLRKTLGKLQIVPPVLNKSPSRTMTEWLANNAVSAEFNIDDTCEFRDPRSVKTVIRCVNQDLFAEEVIGHITAGKEVTQLGLTWMDRLSFVLDAELTIKRIAFTDLIQEAREEIEAETQTEKFDADFAIFTAEIAAMLPALFEVLGGLEETQEAAQTSKEVEVA